MANGLDGVDTRHLARQTTLAALAAKDFSTETTLGQLLDAFNAEDFASQATLAALAAKDFSTETTLGQLLAAFNAEDFASQTTLAALLAELLLQQKDALTDAQLRASRLLVEQTATLQRRTVFVPTSDNPTTIYVGEAARGVATSATGWTIRKTVFTYDVLLNVTNIDETQTDRDAAVMDDYLTETYT